MDYRRRGGKVLGRPVRFLRGTEHMLGFARPTDVRTGFPDAAQPPDEERPQEAWESETKYEALGQETHLGEMEENPRAFPALQKKTQKIRPV